MAPRTAEGAVIPPDLVKLNAVLVDLGMKFYRANGGAGDVPGLTDLRKVLASAGASASGRPPVTVEPAVRPSFTTRQAAAVMGISERRVRHHAAAGRLIAHKDGRDWLIDRQSAEDYRRKESAT